MTSPGRPREDTWHRYAAALAPTLDLESRVHIWRARLDRDVDGFEAILSDDELARADRFHEDRDRRRFVAGRGILRKLIAGLTVPEDADGPKRLRFAQEPMGKPFLVDRPELFFNVSHSEDMALVAVTRAGPVGVDVERVRPMRDTASIADLLFDDAEKAALLGCPLEGREVIFYKIWTRKEALLKAMGLGLTAIKDPNAASIRHGAARWWLMALPHLDGFAGALARPRAAHGMKLWSWPNAADARSAERRVRPRPMPATRRVAPGAFGVRT